MELKQIAQNDSDFMGQDKGGTAWEINSDWKEVARW